MRFVVFGAGGIGGVVGARLAQHGHSVTLIARGDHFKAIRSNGLRLQTPDEDSCFNLSVFEQPSQVDWSEDAIVLLGMKSQDTSAALEALAIVAPAHSPIVCMQNGVANERMALRRFANVYSVFVYCAAGHLAPGVVQAWYAPTTGILDIGRYPAGRDRTGDAVASAFRSSSFLAESRHDIMRWKYRKLLMNLGNAVDALCGISARGSGILDEAHREGVACLEAAAIPYISASEDEDAQQREKALRLRPIGGNKRPGGSTWQSLQRRTHSIETDYLNGEIALLGRLHGVPTPVNDALQRLSNQAAAEGKPPGSMTVEELAGKLKVKIQK